MDNLNCWSFCSRIRQLGEELARYVTVLAIGNSLTRFSHFSASIKTNLISRFLLLLTCITLMVKPICRPTAVHKIHDSMCSELKHYIETMGEYSKFSVFLFIRYLLWNWLEQITGEILNNYEHFDDCMGDCSQYNFIPFSSSKYQNLTIYYKFAFKVLRKNLLFYLMGCVVYVVSGKVPYT